MSCNRVSVVLCNDMKCMSEVANKNARVSVIVLNNSSTHSDVQTERPRVSVELQNSVKVSTEIKNLSSLHVLFTCDVSTDPILVLSASDGPLYTPSGGYILIRE